MLLKWLCFCSILLLSNQYEIVSALNCGSQTFIDAKMLRYTSDEMFEGLTSKSHKKQVLPSTVLDAEDKSLLEYERTINLESDSFGYWLRLKGQDDYILILKFIEVQYQAPNQRVFDVSIGDDFMFKVDISGEAGFGRIFHKWIYFQLHDGILYLNSSHAILNGYIYTTGMIKVTLHRVKGSPKLEALILLKGTDSSTFLGEFLAYEESKNIVKRQYISQRFHNLPHNHYKPMTGQQEFHYPEENFWYYVGKVFSWKSGVSILAVLFLLYHEKVLESLRSLLQPKTETHANIKTE